MRRTLGLVLILSAAAGFCSGYAATVFLTGVWLHPGAAVARTVAWGSHLVRRSSPSYVDGGRKTFERHCATCHGALPGDAVRLAHRTFASRGDVKAFRRVLHAPSHESARPFIAQVSDSKLLAAIAYLREADAQAEPVSTAAAPLPDGKYEYVAHLGGVTIYDIEAGFVPVRHLAIPHLRHQHGIAANVETGLLYISFRREDSGIAERVADVGQLLAIDIASSQLVWTREIRPGIDSFEITSDGAKIYMPTGEEVEGRTEWIVLDGHSGAELARIDAIPGPHNTIVGPDDRFAYLGATGHDHIAVVDTTSDRVIGEVGPFGERIRPFALSRDGRFAVVNVNFLSGFEVADLRSRAVLHRARVEGWPWEDPPLPGTQSHGVAFSPDEREVWVNDTWNRRVHVFDSSRLPDKPHYLGSIDVRGPDGSSERANLMLPKWVRFTRDGRWVHVSNGAIVDAASHEVVTWVLPSRHYVEIHRHDGKPVSAFSRYGNGYRGIDATVGP